MVFFYIWCALTAGILVMAVAEAAAKSSQAASGAVRDWSGYNAVVLTLCLIAFFPVAVLIVCVKKNR